MAARVTGKPTVRRPAPAVSATETDTETAAAVAEPQRVVLGTFGGVECTAPSKIPFRAALRYLNQLRLRSAAIAELDLVATLIGEATLAAVIDATDEKDVWRDLVNAATKHAFGPVETAAEEGNSPGGSPRSCG